jgi:hypothetical protein
VTDFLVIQKQELLESLIIKLNFEHAESFLKDIPARNETYIPTMLLMSVMMLERKTKEQIQGQMFPNGDSNRLPVDCILRS